MTAALAFEGVSVRYGARPALSGVSLRLEAGTLTGLIGPNGAGKTTLLRTGLGLLTCDDGAVTLLGEPLAAWRPRARARAMAYLPQGNDAHWPMRAERVVALGRLPHGGGLDRLSREDEAAIKAALSRCDAAQFEGRRMDALSSGERSRVLLARALATQAQILLADEPSAHLDPAHQWQTMAVLRQEAGRGAAVAVTLHDLSLAARSCDRLAVLAAGRLAAYGPPRDALSDSVLAEVFGVRSIRDGSGGLLAVAPLAMAGSLAHQG